MTIRRAHLAALCGLAATLWHCTPRVLPPTPSPVPAPLPPPAAQPAPPPGFHLPVGGSAFDSYEWQDMLVDRTLAPNISSLKNNPVYALGVVYARVALPTKTCSDTGAGDFKFVRLPSIQKKGCEVESKPASDQLVNKRVKGGAKSTFKFLLGDAAVDGDYAFEFFISEPVSAYFKNVQGCLDEGALARLALPDRVCEVRWIAGVVLTQVATRTYKELKGEAAAAFAVVKIGGSGYYNTSDTTNHFIMTVDTLETSQYFKRDSRTTFLVRARAGTPLTKNATPVPAVAGNALASVPREVRELHLQAYLPGRDQRDLIF